MKNALLVPGVFFLNLLSAVIILAFFGGIALRYELATPLESGAAQLLLICMLQRACYAFPIALMSAVIGVYAFLMRHHAKRIVAISLFLVCTIFTITVIMPICYAQLPSIENALAAYKTTGSINQTLSAFINKPPFLTVLRQGADKLFYDIYAAYTLNFATYLFFICAFFLCISSFWFVCAITRWNLFNLLFLALFSGAFLLVYSYIRQGEFSTTVSNLFLMNTENTLFRAPLLFCIVAVIFHSIGGLKILLIYSKTKKGAPHKNA